ncbi:glycerate kinase [Anopheles nili]|uniref:glycerate kinase n=1 Tax=Anopheles nili TaxID=185578 RepID=UPI00237BEF86|nr:glycerate kinase [Anopheles nili]
MIRSFSPIARKMSSSNATKKLNQLFLSGVEAVKPKALFQGPCSSDNDINYSFKHEHKRYHVVGFGKAVLGMAVQIEKLLGSRLNSGCIAIPIGTTERFMRDSDFCLSPNTTIEVIECALNNLPDETALVAARKITHIAQTMTPDDVLCVLVSGGGSALLCLPKHPITLAEKLQIIKSLSAAGAAIDELNQVRIALSEVKGGQLALAARNAYRVYSYVISDIVGDPVALIASGPTVPQSRVDVNKKATDILIKYNLWNNLPASALHVIAEPTTSDSKVAADSNKLFVLGSNEVAVKCVVQQARSQGLNSIVLSKMVQGNVSAVTDMYVELAELLHRFKMGTLPSNTLRDKIKLMFSRLPYDDLQSEEFVAQVVESMHEPLLIVGAGEPTVCLEGDGKGGRNQELALRFSYGLHQLEHMPDSVCFLSAGTDGIDGPTDVAGAIGGAFVAREHHRLNSHEDGTCFINRNDSYRFYEALDNGKYFIKTGHTGTNVMDLHLLLIEPSA